MAYVARLEPPLGQVRFIREAEGRLFGLIKIAPKDVWPARQYLAVFGNLNFDPGKGAADRRDTVVIERVHGDDRRRFCQAIALEHGDARAKKYEREVGRE